MKSTRTIIALFLTALMLFAACTGKPSPADPTDAPRPSDTEAPGITASPSQDAEYTYRLSLGNRPYVWSPFAWQISDEIKVLRYIEPPLVDISIAEDGVSFTWVFEMAAYLEDVTATYADRERWLSPNEDGSLPEENLIYRIGLNPDAKWADGTPINAATYIYSMQQLLSREITNHATTFIMGDTALKNAAAYLESSPDNEVPWEDVGLIAEDDYTLIYVNEKPASEFTMKSMLLNNWIVYEPLYESSKVVLDNGKVISDYGKSVETTMSCGPYKLVLVEENERMVLERNENWYGWTDGRHEGQYQTTRIEFLILPDEADALNAFIRGELDEVSLTSADLESYGHSENLLKTDLTYTGRFVFATDLEKLKALEEAADDGGNKQVLYCDEFRKAISLSINRAEFCASCTAGFKPAYFLLNNLYYCDIEHDAESQYRDTKEGREAVLRLYGVEYGPGTPYADDVEAYASITGYDVEAARALFREVYERAVAEGLYTDGQEIHIRCEVSRAALSDDDLRQQDHLNEYVAAAAVGTGFEGRITFEFIGEAEDREIDIANGRIEMIRAAWGGAPFYPFSSIRVYCEPDYMGGLLSKIQESCGWDPTAETITIGIDGEEITDTIQNWAKSINEGGKYFADEYADIRLVILSHLESAILGSYQCIPYGSYTDCSLFSKKIRYAAAEYNLMYGYGGVRLMTYNFSDAEWDEFVKSQGGSIDYR